MFPFFIRRKGKCFAESKACS